MTNHIFLSITEKCNLNCVYCFEKSKRKDVMSFEMAIAIIEKEMKNDAFDMLDIDFMGGEPFLEFPTIKAICEYMWEREWPRKYKFSATTNGTFVHGEIKEWLRLHKEQFICFISLDGIKKAHDINRSNSFDLIDIDFFRNNWPQNKVKMLCSKQSLDYLADSVKYMCELGFPEIELKLAYSFDWRDRYDLHKLKEQYEILTDFYVDNPDLVIPSLLSIDMMDLNYPGKKIKKWCTVGVGTASYDMSGEYFPCRYYQDLVRYKKLSYDQVWNEDYKNIQNQLKGRCLNCLLRDVCRTCYAYNFDTCGDYGIKNDYSCNMTKVCAYYSALIIIKRVENNVASTYEKSAIDNANKVISMMEDLIKEL